MLLKASPPIELNQLSEVLFNSVAGVKFRISLRSILIKNIPPPRIELGHRGLCNNKAV